MSPKRLVLFDVDGTLIHGGALWRECFDGALKELFPDLKFPTISFGGKTDVQICRETMAHAGFEEAQVQQNMLRIIDEYLRRAAKALETRTSEVVVLPGVREILESLHTHPDIIVGLLTGNVRAGAEVKLGAVGLEHYFKVGVFGDDHWDRYELPALAVERAKQELGFLFAGKQVVIIGDTIHDVNCGKSIGVRSIAVGTGRGVDRAELLAQNPDYFFRDLSSTFEVLAAILE